MKTGIIDLILFRKQEFRLNKSFRRMSAFVSGVFDFHIMNFNDTAFYEEVRNNNFGSVPFSDKFDIHPSVRFGIRF